jgi:hypothetical protein
MSGKVNEGGRFFCPELSRQGFAFTSKSLDRRGLNAGCVPTCTIDQPGTIHQVSKFAQAWLWWIGLHVGAAVWFADQLEETEKQWAHALGRRK